MTMTSSPASRIVKMSELDLAMEKYIEGTTLRDNRPVRAVELRHFNYGDKDYKMSYGTCRNKLSKLRKAGKIQVQYRHSEAYYSVPGYSFAKQIKPDRVGGTLPLVGRQTPLYKWLKNRPTTKQSLHDIRLTFSAIGMWNTYSTIFPDYVNPANFDIALKSISFLSDIEVKVTVHHSDTVSVAIASSFKPLVIDIPDILYLIEVLTRVESTLSAYCTNFGFGSVFVPRYTNWIAKLWHFGWDTLDRYDGEQFHVTFEEGISDLWRTYTKKMKDGKKKVRIEHQDMPNKPVLEAVLNKIFSEEEIPYRIMNRGISL